MYWIEIDWSLMNFLLAYGGTAKISAEHMLKEIFSETVNYWIMEITQ
jgi:hypothetical protein